MEVRYQLRYSPEWVHPRRGRREVYPCPPGPDQIGLRAGASRPSRGRRAESQPREAQELEGKVVASSRDRVVVRDDGGDLLLLHLRDSTRIHEHDRRLEPEDLRPDMHVKVRIAPEAYEERQDTASEIEMMEESSG